MPLIYRSDLADRLPAGLAVPRAIAMRDLDPAGHRRRRCLHEQPSDDGRFGRAHALCMLIYSGLPAFPIEHLAMEPTGDLHRIAAERAATATFILDLVDATASR